MKRFSNYLTKYTKKQDKGSQMKLKQNKKRFNPRYFMSERTDLPEAAEEVVETTTEPMEEVEAENVHEQVTPENLQLVVDAVIKMATGPLSGVFIAALALFGWSLVKEKQIEKNYKDSDQPK